MVAQLQHGPNHTVCLQECWEGQPLPRPSRMRAGVPGEGVCHGKGSGTLAAVAQLRRRPLFSEGPATSLYRMEPHCGHLHFL